jgi:hypothetical protein
VFFSSRHYRPNKVLCRTAGIVVSGGKIYSCGVGRKLRFYVNIFFCQTKNAVCKISASKYDIFFSYNGQL